MYSDNNGVSWSPSKSNVATYNSITSSNIGTIVAIGDTYFCISSQPNTFSASSIQLQNSQTWNSIKYGNGVFVAVANATLALANTVVVITGTSVQDASQNYHNASDQYNWTSVTYGLDANGPVFVAVSSDGYVMRSLNNGESWTTVNTSSIDGIWSSVAFGVLSRIPTFVAVASNGKAMISIDSGVTWSDTPLSPNNINWSSVTFGNNSFVAVSSNGGYSMVYSKTLSPGSTYASNVTCIGYGAESSGDASGNEITLGNTSIELLRCHATSITAISDERDKTQIVPLRAGLDFVEELNPVDFIWNMRDGGKVGIPDIGFIAQELQRAQINTNIRIPGLVYDVNPNRLEASYGKLIPVLVKAIKDLKDQVDVLNEEIKQLKDIVNK
jgi:hypothetical protein